MKKVLIVDDDRELVARIGTKLKHLGYKCRGEMSGRAALEFLKSNPVDLVVLDVMIPEMSGFEVCRQIRRIPELVSLPVLFLSSMSSEEEIDHALSQGGDDFLPKPFHIDDLVRHIERLLMSSGSNGVVDEATTLLGAKGIKLEVQNALLNRRPFSLIYIQLEQLPELMREFGGEIRDRAMRHFSRALLQCGEKLESELFAAGHLGGGHFLVLVEDEVCRKFCKSVQVFWDNYLPRFYEGINAAKRFEKTVAGVERGEPVAVLRPMFCVTRHNGRSTETVTDLLDALSHVRESALASGREEIVFDRRVS